MPMIIGEIKRYLRDNNAVRVSRSMRDTAYKALSAREKLSSTLGREPNLDEITTYLCQNGTETTKADVSEALEAIVDPVSLYDPVCGEGGDEMCVMDRVTDGGEGEERWIEDIALREAMKRLGKREKNIIDMRFYRGRTQMEIAEEIGISQAQVSRLEKGALERIRKQM